MSAEHILVVEDDPDAQDMIAELLSGEGYDVATANDGLEALAYLNVSPTRASLILLDLMMPNMDGVGLRQEQLKAPSLASIPVALLSAKNDVAQVAGAMGAAGFVQKPVTAEALIELVDSILHQQP